MKELSGIMEMFYNFTEWVTKWDLSKLIKPHLKSVHFIVYKLHQKSYIKQK